MSDSARGHGITRLEFVVPGWIDGDLADPPDRLAQEIEQWRFDPYHLTLTHKRRWWGGRYTVVLFEAEQYHQDKLEFMRSWGVIE